MENSFNIYTLLTLLLERMNKLEGEIKYMSEELLETDRGVMALVENLRNKNKEQLEQIKKQQEALLHADRMVSLGQLVAGIAHEINNPNTYIRLNIDLLRKYCKHVKSCLSKNEKFDFEEIAFDIKNVLDSMYDGTERIMDIVSGLKIFSRQDKNKLDNFDIKEVIKKSYNLTCNEFKIKGVEFRNYLDKDSFIICGSERQMEQVFINLFLNSVKALNNVERSVKYIMVDVSNKTKKSITLCVQDNGCGISKKNLKMVFNPFFTTNIDDGGTGLGLSIVYGIVNEHNGHIEIKSIENEFTKIYIDLPISQAE